MVDLALVQVASPDTESPADRIARVEQLLRSHAGAELYLLPEIWSAGYFSFDHYEERSESFDGPTISMCRRVARELNATIHVGSFIERDLSGTLHNTTALIAPSGRITQVYRKIHVFGYQSREAQLLTPGTTLGTVDSPIGTLSSVTCYDLRFPGLWQEISRRGAEAVAVPAAWPAARRKHWQLLTTARAVEHQLFVVAVNACDSQHGVELGGHSRVVNPSGEVIAECGDTEQVLRVQLNPDDVSQVRTHFPVIADRLDDYSSLAHENGAEQ